jgi:hypothetical protein
MRIKRIEARDDNESESFYNGSDDFINWVDKGAGRIAV